MKKVIFLIGPACAGKGTQGKLLNIPAVSAGDILRKMFVNNIEETNKLNNGIMISIEVTNKAIIDFINSQEICLIDGYPRNIDQANFVKSINAYKKYIVLTPFCKHDNCSKFACKEILLSRTLNRYFCHICQRTFNKEILCCQQLTTKRKDDNEEIFSKRYKDFNSNIYDIISILEGSFFFINANDSIENIHQKIDQIIKL